ncbi:MAG: hypothetical protein K9L21_05085 [Spirochaetia bacterium]|nr:hypothetical protein [Spirochaetia bacterium]
MSRPVPVLAITETEILEFPSVLDAAESYGCRPSLITNLIARNQVFRDGRTWFDYAMGGDFEAQHIGD